MIKDDTPPSPPEPDERSDDPNDIALERVPDEPGRDEAALPMDPQVPPAPEDIDIFGCAVVPENLLMMRAEDHYVMITDTENSQVVRGTFSKAVDLMPADLGIQVNRSVWVARRNVLSVMRTKDNALQVATKNGNSFAVSRSRKRGVRDTLAAWDIPVKKAAIRSSH